MFKCEFVLVLLFFAGSSLAFVFSCDEIKYKLIDTNLEVSTRYVCLTQGNAAYYDSACLSQIYARSDNVSTSFSDLLNWTCIDRSGEGPWRITTDPNPPCPPTKYNDLALIFTTSRPRINVVEYEPSQIPTASLEGEEQIFAYPETGIYLRTRGCNGNGNITVFTGAGRGEEEHRFKMKTWRCVDLPDWIVAFDDVITVAVDEDVQLILEYENKDQMMGMDVTQADRIAVMSSGRSDNSQNSETRVAYAHNYIKFNADKKLIASASCAPCEFDPNHNGLLRLTAYNGNIHDTTETIVHNSSTVNINFASTLNVEYSSDSISPQDVWESNDNFVVEFTFKDSELQTTPEPILSTSSLSLVITTEDVPELTTLESIKESDPYCGCALDKKFGMAEGWNSTEIWLDVVIILDSSAAMGEDPLVDACTLISSLIGTEDTDVLNTNTNSEFFTRIGLIAMSDEAQVLFNLNLTKFDNVLDKVKVKEGVIGIDVVDAFNAALSMLNEGLISRADRIDTRQVIYYITNSDPKTDLGPLNQFKTSQGIIIVNDFIEKGQIERAGLKELASDGYYRSDIQYNYMDTIQLFCKANCFCSADKIAYAGRSSDPAIRAAGGCFHAASVGVPFSKAKSNCAKMGDGLLASFHDQQKTEFAQQLMSKSAPKSNYFWIGYSKADGGWTWEDQSIDPYTNWGDNEPNPSSISNCAYEEMNSPGTNWFAGNCNVGFPSLCEFPPCSVGHKC